MESESTISKSIRSTDENARYDSACKKVLSEKIILAWIMKSCAEEFRDVDVKEIADHCIEGTPEVSEVPVDPAEEVNVMCNLSKGVWEKGRRSGMEEGRRSGMKEGRESEKLEDIRSLMLTLKLSSDQAMQALQIPESEQPKYEELLKV